jgi:nitrous oxidase accessory protein NosD
MGNYIQKIVGFLAFLLVLASINSQAQTNVSGVISTNSTWSKINSPYKITGNVQVNSGITLTIEPGVQVVFQDNFYLKILGTINSVGTVGDSIIFKSSNSNNWSGILLINSTTTLNSDYSYASGSIFKYNSFKSSNKALFVYNSGFYIENCKFQDNLIGFEPRASSKGLLKSTTFLNNTTGIYTEYEDNTTGYGVSCIKDFKLQGNLFESNTTGANLNMNQRTFDNLQVINNIFTSNNTGLTLGGGGYGPYLANVLISNNNFTSNTYGLNISNIYSNGYNGCTGTLSFPLIIEKNLINNNSSTGLSFSYSGNNHTVRNNIILSNSIGISITGTTSSVSFQKNSLFENKKTISINGSSYYEPSSLLFTTNTFKNSSVNSSDYIILNNVTNNNNKAIANNFIDISNNFLVKNINRGQFNLESNYVKLPSGISSINDIIYDINDDVSLGEVVITSPSNTLTITAPLNPVHNVTKNLTGSGIVLSWSANNESDIAGYKIYYGGYTGYSYTNSIDVGNVTSTTLSAGIGIDENFAVTAYDASKDGTDDQYDGNESWYSTANKIPNAPTNLVAVSSGHKVKLNWDVSTSSGVNNYNIYILKKFKQLDKSIY